jgi:hypothetical protein
VLISATNLKAVTDKWAWSWNRVAPHFGSKSDVVPTVPSVRNAVSMALAVVVGSGDYEQELDLAKAFNDSLTATGVESALGYLGSAITALENHCRARGAAVNPSINSIATYLAYLNSTPFTQMLAPGFSDLYAAAKGGTRPPHQSVFSRGISPDLNAAAYPSGLGTRAVGGAFTDGAAPDVTKYGEVTPIAVLTADFVGGTGAPTVTVTGVDSAGTSGTTWTGTFGSNNPTSAIATTFTPALLAQARQTVAVASAAGLIAGQTATINSGLPDQEVVVLEAVNTGGNTVTVVSQAAHNAGATLTAKRSIALTPSVSGVRLRDCTGIAIGITGHSAGTLRIDGVQDRVAV